MLAKGWSDQEVNTQTGQVYNIYLLDLKHIITYKTIWGEDLRSDRFLYHEMPRMAKKIPHNLHD